MPSCPGSIGPAIELYGCSVSTTPGLTTEDVAVSRSRCFNVRYCAAVIVTVSDGRLITTAVIAGADTAPTRSVATACRRMVVEMMPGGSVTVNRRSLVLNPLVGLIVGTPGAPMFSCVHLNVQPPPTG